MALTIYGSPRSRTMRTLWAAAELGLEYTHIPIAFDDPALRSPAFRRINPAAAIPTIVDGDFTLSESLAINLYLAKKYGSSGDEPLYPSTLEGEAEMWRWSLWAQAHLEPWVQRDALLADLRAAIANRADAIVDRALGVLDGVLAERPWLAASHFTVADLNVAAVLSPSRAGHLDFSTRATTHAWLTRCYERPAAAETRRRFAQ
jgi:glutathione S-transferase